MNWPIQLTRERILSQITFMTKEKENSQARITAPKRAVAGRKPRAVSQRFETVPPHRKERSQGGNPVLSHRDLRQGLKFLRVNIESISQDAGCQVPLDNGQLMMTKLAKNMNGHFTTSCGEFTKSQDQDGSQLISWIQSNSTIGLIILVRALEFESLSGLDFLKTDSTDPTLTVNSPLGWHAAPLQAKRFSDRTNQDKIIDTSADTTLTIMQRETLWLKSGGDPMCAGGPEIIWQLIPCSRNTNSEQKQLLSKKPRVHYKIHPSLSQKKWHIFLDNVQDNDYKINVKSCERTLSYSWLKRSRDTRYAGILGSRGEFLCYARKSFFYLQAFEVLPRRGLRCGHGARAGKNFQVLPHSQRLRHLLRRHSYRMRQKGRSHVTKLKEIRATRMLWLSADTLCQREDVADEFGFGEG